MAGPLLVHSEPKDWEVSAARTPPLVLSSRVAQLTLPHPALGGLKKQLHLLWALPRGAALQHSPRNHAVGKAVVP